MTHYNYSKSYSLTGNGAADIAAVANAQVGKTKAQLGYTEHWCADFVSDCGKLAGQSDAVGFSGAPSELYNHYGYKGTRNGFAPAVGDIAFICSCWGLNEAHYYEHVGVVVAVTDSIVTTVEGNIFDNYGNSKVVKYNYNRSTGNVVTNWKPWNKIVRYGRPNYKGVVIDKEKPIISDVRVSNLTSSGYTVTCKVSDNTGVTEVKFPTWTAKVVNGTDQDELIWHVGSLSGNTASFTVRASDHKSESGQYITDIYAYDAVGNFSMVRVSPVVPPAEPPKICSTPQITSTDIVGGENSDNNLWRFGRACVHGQAR